MALENFSDFPPSPGWQASVTFRDFVSMVISAIYIRLYYFKGFPGGSDGKESFCNAGDPVGREDPPEENGHPLQYSCLGNPMDRGPWWAVVHRVAKSRT